LEEGPKASASVIKYAGDDPDVTDGMRISVTLRYSDRDCAAGHDHVEKCGSGKIVITSGGGVGLVTRPGLDVEPGKWAVNPGPRKIISANLLECGYGGSPSVLEVKITAENGEVVASRTLNPLLGVRGGISILGNSGIVEPYSNAAYIHTIRIRVRSAAAEGARELGFVTGTRTMKFLLEEVPSLKEKHCIRIADFIADSLRAASSAGIHRVYIGCMPGKLYKYACGYEYTHAHRESLKPDFMMEVVREISGGSFPVNSLAGCRSVREMASMMPDSLYRSAVSEIKKTALSVLKEYAGSTDVVICLLAE
jgi:cobalt-precorrin-5B (C1)-methyltransferase